MPSRSRLPSLARPGACSTLSKTTQSSAVRQFVRAASPMLHAQCETGGRLRKWESRDFLENQDAAVKSTCGLHAKRVKFASRLPPISI
eukprot:6189035-Pleurochrysis_carterae.AAC.2